MGKKSKKAGESTKTTNTNENGMDHASSITVPMEVSAEEYQDLVAQAMELTEQEAQQEWMDCARYGEVDAIRALLGQFPTFIHMVDPTTGNTALHMAAANGHTNVAKLLLSHQHPFTKNHAGNTPLHWAASNGQATMVEWLTHQDVVPVDVLEKNEFGRSALTEGFTSQREDVVKALLEHESASEEKLLSTNGSTSNDAAMVVHQFFHVERPLIIRELAIANADHPFADTERPDQDTTGFSIWSASLILARWMMTKTWTSTTRVLELGAGCGVPGLAVAQANPRPEKVYVTDLNPLTVDNLQHNIQLNHLQSVVEAVCMDWEQPTTWPQEPLSCVMGSDLIYQASLVPLLVSVVLGLLAPGGTFYYVAPDTGRDGLKEFIQEMKAQCPNWREEIAPKEYHENPLTNQDDDECFLHFQELSSLTYVLYQFTKPIETTEK